ncbi:MAG: S41 family peptidase [Cyclobacteriaceae bacterium]
MRKIIFLMAVLPILGCVDDDAPTTPGQVFDPENPNLYVNTWIQEEMDFWYLWKSEFPADPDETQNPDNYFSSILSSKDRFSWIQDDYLELLGSLQGVSNDTGHEIRYLNDAENPGNVIGQILYVKPGSPSDFAGMQRGDLITHVNGTLMTSSNYRDLNSDMNSSHDIEFIRYSFETDEFSTLGPVSINPIQFSENPNFLDTIFNYEGAKIGYYVYNQFSSGPTSADQSYVTEMDAIFQNFRSQRIDHLIVDLRYNPGGAITVATNLGSLIGSGVGSQDVFALRQYNADLQQLILNDASLGSNFLENKFEFKTANVGGLIDKVYVLTGYRTASASELLINGLRPFMEVFMIGDTTVGKNQASVSLFEENDPNNTWGIQPIVASIGNSLGESDYEDGLFPHIADQDLSRKLYPLGDIRENLLSLAIENITGVFPARIRRVDDGTRAMTQPNDPRLNAPILLDDELSDLLLKELR